MKAKRRERVRATHTGGTLIVLAVACTCIRHATSAFAPPPAALGLDRRSPGTSLYATPSPSPSPLGDVLSGLTGRPPSSLAYPADVLEGTNLDRAGIDLRCVYKASRDGWSAVDFHRCVDERGSGLVVCLSQSGKKFGGYNPLGWRSSDDYGSSNSAFLWFTDRSGEGSVKCPALSGGQAVVFDYATGGPTFGSADLCIGPPQAAVLGGFAGPDMMDTASNAGNLREGTSSVGGAYDTRSGWPARGKFRLVELEVYCDASISPGGSGGGFNLWPF